MKGSAPPPHRTADLVLMAVTAAWGLTFPAIKQAVGDTHPLLFLGLRLLLAFAGLLLLFRGSLLRGWRGRLTQGLVLGAIFYVSYATQAVGLQYTSASRSAFITGLSVALVPFLYVPIRKRAPGLLPSLGAALAVAGLFLLTRPDLGRMNRGDVMTLGCALAYAFYLVLLERFGTDRPAEPLIGLQAATAAGLGLLALPAMPLVGAGRALFHAGPGLWIGLAVTVPVAMFTIAAQTRWQPRTTATRAAVIFSAEPVFALIFSALWLGDRLDGSGLLGAALILAGVVLAVVK